MKLDEKIMTLRRQKGWSQEELAMKLDVSRQAVSKWESGMSIPDLDKILKMSEIFGVCTDYLLKEGMEMDCTSSKSDCQKEEVYEELSERFVSKDEAHEYIEFTKANRWKIAIGVVMCIISPILLILLAGFANANMFGITDGIAGGVGVVVLLLLVAGAVTLFITTGMKFNNYEYLGNQKILIDVETRHEVQEMKKAYQSTYVGLLATGIALCILAVVPLMIAAMCEAQDIVILGCICGLLAIVGIAVFMFVIISYVKGSYTKLLQEADYSIDSKKINKKISWLPGAYWCLATAIYLCISFITDDWSKSWIVWPVAGVLFGAIYGIMSGIIKNKSK